MLLIKRNITDRVRSPLSSSYIFISSPLFTFIFCLETCLNIFSIIPLALYVTFFMFCWLRFYYVVVKVPLPSFANSSDFSRGIILPNFFPNPTSLTTVSSVLAGKFWKHFTKPSSLFVWLLSFAQNSVLTARMCLLIILRVSTFCMGMRRDGRVAMVKNRVRA